MTERQYKLKIIKNMKALGVYRVEFALTIDRLAALYVYRDVLEEKFALTGGSPVAKHTNKAGATNTVKNPFLVAREEVYTQLLAYERELGMTPLALKRINEASLKPKKQSAFADALKALSG